MNYSEFNKKSSQEVIALFTETFTNSEGEEEGTLIGNLVSDLTTTTDEQDLFGFIAQNDEKIVGGIFFSRFFLTKNKTAFMLAPVAIATDYQGQGIGQKLINFGLKHLKSLDIDLTLTYGDPNFYGKVGFQQITEDIIKAPFKLNYPHGWLAQSLKNNPIETINGPTKCVAAFNNPKYW